jgi:hypothetical protein
VEPAAGGVPATVAGCFWDLAVSASCYAVWSQRLGGSCTQHAVRALVQWRVFCLPSWLEVELLKLPEHERASGITRVVIMSPRAALCVTNTSAN